MLQEIASQFGMAWTSQPLTSQIISTEVLPLCSSWAKLYPSLQVTVILDFKAVSWLLGLVLELNIGFEQPPEKVALNPIPDATEPVVNWIEADPESASYFEPILSFFVMEAISCGFERSLNI